MSHSSWGLWYWQNQISIFKEHTSNAKYHLSRISNQMVTMVTWNAIYAATGSIRQYTSCLQKNGHVSTKKHNSDCTITIVFRHEFRIQALVWAGLFEILVNDPVEMHIVLHVHTSVKLIHFNIFLVALLEHLNYVDPIFVIRRISWYVTES